MLRAFLEDTSVRTALASVFDTTTAAPLPSLMPHAQVGAVFSLLALVAQ
jgi:hypothetical protein